MSEHQYTEEELRELSYRDLQGLAKELGQNAKGSTEELIDRILNPEAGDEVTTVPAGQTPSYTPADASATAPDGPAGEDGADDVSAGVGSLPVSTSGAAGPVGEIGNPDPVGEYVPGVDDTKAVKLTPRSKTAAGHIVAGYITAEAYTKDVEREVVGAIESGKQPCIVRGSGNTKFALKVFDTPFAVNDVKQDVVKSKEVVLNIARRLADVNLYPR